MSPSKSPATIHVDLDGASAIYTMHGWSYPYDSDPLFESGLTNLLALFEKLDITATLFVIADDLDDPKKLTLLKKAVDKGHEIACHSHTHRKLTRLSHDERVHEVSDSRENISRMLNTPVDGFRAPYFDINSETLLLVANSGYKYDSSLFQGTSLSDGNQCLTAGYRPGPLWQDQSLLELPLPGYSPLPFPFHASYSLVLGTWYFRLGLHRFRKTDAPLVLLFHLTDLADPLPANMAGNWRKRFFTLSHLNGPDKQGNCMRILEHVADYYRVVTTSTLLDMALPATDN